MRHGFTFVLISACFGALFLICYAPALFLDRQFGYRDAGHYYYPLNKRVQAEWNQGRWPLWEPEENAGMPLLGNPTAAVLYPGKVVFAVLPYAWAARVYIVAHSALAFATTLVLMRSWGTSWIGSALSALAYAFGAPILFQNCNIIYLIGAAWLPLGVHAVDRWVRLGRRWGLWELAIVLSMQVLGGDPQAAYLLGLASIGYALGLAWSRAKPRREKHAPANRGHSKLWLSLPLVASGLVLWCAVTLAHWLPKLRDTAGPISPPRLMLWVPVGVTAAWALVGVGFLLHWRARGWRSPLGAMLLGLATSAALSAALTAAQLLPVIEFTQQTGRAGSAAREIYQFSLEPFRPLELIWPNIQGMAIEGASYWGDVIKTPGGRPKGWVPSLYLGGLTVALAVSTLATRHGPPWRIWLIVIASVGLLGSLGKYTSPIWAARALAVASSSATLRNWLPDLGPFDPIDSLTIRHDGYPYDSDGCFYWWLATILPGFRQFRYPAKLFTLTALAMSVLAGLGWDNLGAGRARGTATVFFMLLVLTLAALGVVVYQREPILASFRALNSPSYYGPFDAVAGYQAILRSLEQAVIVLGLGLVLTSVARRRALLAGSTALVVMTADLAVANSRYVLTVPQAVFESKPELVKVIEEAERTDPSPGPFRIHRMPIWYPLSWTTTPSKDRIIELARWERDALQAKHGMNFGVEYTHTIGVAQLDDYERFFTGFSSTVRDEQVAQSLGIKAAEQVICYPRRAYDMWNTRYFIVPFDANGWHEATRGFASFVFQSELVYPEPGRFIGPDGALEARNWIETRDFRVLRNLVEYPRSWIVHGARAAIPITEPSRGRPSKTMQEILYAADPIWNDAPQRVYDPHTLAWMGNDDRTAIRDYLSGQTTGPSETVKVTYPTPQQAVLEARLDSPGLVILADVYYPGWELTIDGKPAPIYRVNGLMRGAAVAAGAHRLVYTYAPQSFRVGRLGSIAGLAALLILGVAFARRPLDPILAGRDESIDHDA